MVNYTLSALAQLWQNWFMFMVQCIRWVLLKDSYSKISWNHLFPNFGTTLSNKYKTRFPRRFLTFWRKVLPILQLELSLTLTIVLLFLTQTKNTMNKWEVLLMEAVLSSNILKEFTWLVSWLRELVQCSELGERQLLKGKLSNCDLLIGYK